MPRISTIGATTLSADIRDCFLSWMVRRGPARGRSPAGGNQRMCVVRSVRARRESLSGLLLRERLVFHVRGLLDRLAVQHVLHEAGSQLAEERVALHDEVDLAVDESLHAVVDRVDRDDLDVNTRD